MHLWGKKHIWRHLPPPFLLWSSSISSTAAPSPHQIPHSNVIMAQQWRKSSRNYYYYYIKGYFDCLNVHFTWRFNDERVCEKHCCFTMPAEARLTKRVTRKHSFPNQRASYHFIFKGRKILRLLLEKPHILLALCQNILCTPSLCILFHDLLVAWRFGGLLHDVRVDGLS